MRVVAGCSVQFVAVGFVTCWLVCRKTEPSLRLSLSLFAASFALNAVAPPLFLERVIASFSHF